MTREELWNSDDCAAFFRCSTRHFRDRIRYAAGFPPEIRIPTLGGRSRPLWRAEAIREYVTRFEDSRQNHASAGYAA